jgi:hypothetical protein
MTLEVFWRHLKNGQFCVPNPFVHGAYHPYPLWMAVVVLTVIIGLIVGVVTVLVLSSKRREENPLASRNRYGFGWRSDAGLRRVGMGGEQ